MTRAGFYLDAPAANAIADRIPADWKLELV